MGRNTGSQIHFTHAVDDSGFHTIQWYCQQHGKWDSLTSTTLSAAFATLKTEMETNHGNVEQ